MKPTPFDYVRAESVEHAVAVLGEHGDDAKVLAGGQSLLPLLSMRFARPAVLVDVSRLTETGRIEGDGAVVSIGATVRQAELGTSSAARTRAPLAARAVPLIGHHATRNRGTVGGSIAHADARAELPLALLASGGSVLARSTRGAREIAAGELFTTHFTTTLAPDELIVESRWPAAGTGWGYAIEELSQRHGDFALALVAVALRRDGDAVAEARVAVGAVGERPSRVPAAEQALIGSRLDEAAPAAARAAANAFEPADDLHATGAYRRHMTGVLAKRALERAWAEAGAPTRAAVGP